MQKLTNKWNREIPKPNDIYRHFKGHVYPIIATGVHTEDKSQLVVYQSHDGIWARPIDMFLSPVDGDKYPDADQAERFQRVTDWTDIPVNVNAPVNCHHGNTEAVCTAANRPLPKKGEIYRHFKGGYIVILAVAIHTEDETPLVVYAKNGDIWIRPLDMFLSPVNRIKYPDATQQYRLEKIE